MPLCCMNDARRDGMEPMDELRELRGLQQATVGKNTRSCEYRSDMSLPRKICAADSDHRAGPSHLGDKSAAGPQHVCGDVQRLAT